LELKDGAILDHRKGFSYEESLGMECTKVAPFLFIMRKQILIGFGILISQVIISFGFLVLHEELEHPKDHITHILSNIACMNANGLTIQDGLCLDRRALNQAWLEEVERIKDDQ